MNNLTLSSAGSEPQTMSSLDIAEITGKRHDNVLRGIEKTLSDLEISQLKFQSAYSDKQGKARKHYLLPKDLVLMVLTGYTAKMRYKVIQRVLEMEKRERQPVEIDYTDPRHVARFMEAQQAKALELENRVASLESSEKALDALSKSDDSYTPTEVAKLLGVPRKSFLAYFRARKNGWLWQRRKNGVGYGEYLAFQPRIDAGELESCIVSYEVHGKPKFGTQIRITPKGLIALTKVKEEIDNV